MTPTQIRKVVTIEADAYSWRHGCHVKVDADKAVTELRGIYQRDGAVTPAAVVEAARPADAVLHEEFEWSDAEAARVYREEQARYLLRSLVVVYKRPDNTRTEPVRAFVKIVPSADDPTLDDVAEDAVQPHVYLPVRRVMEEPDLRQRIRRQMFRELASWRQRYRDADGLARVFDAIDAALAELQASTAEPSPA